MNFLFDGYFKPAHSSNYEVLELFSKNRFREKSTCNEQVIKLRRANLFDKFQLGLRQIIENLMIQRMADNDKEFGTAAFAFLSKAIYDSIPVTNLESKLTITRTALIRKPARAGS